MLLGEGCRTRVVWRACSREVCSMIVRLVGKIGCYSMEVLGWARGSTHLHFYDAAKSAQIELYFTV